MTLTLLWQLHSVYKKYNCLDLIWHIHRVDDQEVDIWNHLWCDHIGLVWILILHKTLFEQPDFPLLDLDQDQVYPGSIYFLWVMYKSDILQILQPLPVSCMYPFHLHPKEKDCFDYLLSLCIEHMILLILQLLNFSEYLPDDKCQCYYSRSRMDFLFRLLDANNVQ